MHTSIAVSGTDVYVCGKENSRPVYWKNGTKYFLSTTNNGSNGIAHDMVIVGTTLYIVGFELDNFGVPKARLWTNGVGSNLSSSSSLARSIAVIGTNVYIAGEQNDLPVYWFNGQLNSLNTTANLDRIKQVFVENQDIYVARAVFGNSTGNYDHWKNGIQTDAPNLKSIHSITKFGTFFYFCGNNTNNVAAFTQNNVETVLDTNYGEVMGIVVN